MPDLGRFRQRLDLELIGVGFPVHVVAQRDTAQPQGVGPSDATLIRGTMIWRNCLEIRKKCSAGDGRRIGINDGIAGNPAIGRAAVYAIDKAPDIQRQEVVRVG